MYSLIVCLKNFIKDTYSFPYYGAIFLFLTFSVWLNYQVDLENSVIDKERSEALRLFYYILLYGSAYYGTLWIAYFAKRDFYFNRNVLIRSGIIIIILAVYAGYWGHMKWLNVHFNTSQHYIFKSIAHQLFQLLVALIGSFIVERVFKEKAHFFGLSNLHINWSPYFYLFAGAVFIAFIASFFEDFTSYYPTYKANISSQYYQLPEWLFVLSYETAYGASFVAVELLFRGLMVVWLMRWVGKEAVISMAVTYCFLHFGKPMGEAISSFFGGYLLGIIAYYSRSIFAGVVVHLTLAWSMEFFAFWQKMHF